MKLFSVSVPTLVQQHYSARKQGGCRELPGGPCSKVRRMFSLPFCDGFLIWLGSEEIVCTKQAGSPNFSRSRFRVILGIVDGFRDPRKIFRRSSKDSPWPIPRPARRSSPHSQKIAPGPFRVPLVEALRTLKR
eukprot:1192215-Prorocentrum_minimum.AAC.1